MPITVPPFVSLQTQAVPLKGNWRRPPKNSDGSPQDDMFVSQELDWPIGGATNGNAVLINVAGNSPQTLAQIAALVVDNSRCGSDVSFIFPDTGFELTVDARASGVFAVLTNALQFYAVAANALTGDITILQICNTVPPVIAQFPTSAQQNVTSAGIALANGSTAIVAAGTNGTLESFSIIFTGTTGASVGTDNLTLQDGTGKVLWSVDIFQTASTSQTLSFNSPPGMNVRFSNGINLVQGSVANFTAGAISANLYFSKP